MRRLARVATERRSGMVTRDGWLGFLASGRCGYRLPVGGRHIRTSRLGVLVAGVDVGRSGLGDRQRCWRRRYGRSVRFVSDLRHFLDMPDDTPAPARRMAEHPTLVVRVATAGDAGLSWVKRGEVSASAPPSCLWRVHGRLLRGCSGIDPVALFGVGERRRLSAVGRTHRSTCGCEARTLAAEAAFE